MNGREAGVMVKVTLSSLVCTMYMACRGHLQGCQGGREWRRAQQWPQLTDNPGKYSGSMPLILRRDAV